MFTIKQLQCLRKIWSSISQVLVLTGYGLDLCQDLSVVRSTLESDNASIDSIRKNLSELFVDTLLMRFDRLELSCVTTTISKAFSESTTN